MPIYEYACKNCGHTLDELQKISDELLVDCPECGQAQLKRLLSAPRFRLKGAGWYETDFKKDKQRNLVKGEADAKAGADKPDAAGSDKSNGSKADSDSTPTKTAEKSSESKPEKAKASESKPAASKAE